MAEVPSVPEEPSFRLFREDPRPGSADTRLLCAVVARMQRDPRVRAERICIEVQNRVVILAGVVTAPDIVPLAGGHAWGTPGVHDVSNQLRCLDEPSSGPA
ncbi:BON domain-containing protein [Micromonospora sp. NPDC049497]|uniref:BON domain-containing protein n=1 Tax=Micromonospora sp. NPDC049497 TaxID=3364273 RepID=UPI0037B96A3D